MSINSSLVLNVTTLTYDNDGLQIAEPTGTSLFYAQSDYANLLLVDIKDGGATNSTTLINFRPNIKKPYTSHWFYMQPQGIVEKLIDNEMMSFYRFSIRIPNIVLSNNDVREVVENQITIQRRLGTKHLGNYATLQTLEGSFDFNEIISEEGAEEEITLGKQLSDELSVAYVLATDENKEENQDGFYQVVYNLDLQVYEWEKIDNISTRLQRKQYSLGIIKVSAGYATDMDIPNIEDETLFVFMDILSETQASIVAFDDTLNQFNTRLTDVELEIPNKLNISGGNAKPNIKLRDTTFDLGVDTDAIKQTDFSEFAIQGKTNLNAYIDDVQLQIDDKLSQSELGENFYNKQETNNLLDEKTNIGHAHVEADITNLDKYTQAQTDILLAVKSNVGHAHVETDITNLDKYSQSQADNKFMSKVNYLDAHDKILLSKLPDSAKQQTYVVAELNELPTTSIISGDKGFVTSTGNSYIWDGSVWQLSADADWENVNLDWNNIVDKPDDFPPEEHQHVEADITDLDKYSIEEINNLLDEKSDVGHKHVEADITDLDKYSKNEADILLQGKANVIHNHVEADITDLDKYTQLETNNLLSNKSDLGHTHTKGEITDFAHNHMEQDITNLDKYTQQEVNELLDDKSDIGHTHIEADITNLDKYTQNQVDTALDLKVDKNINSYTEVTEFSDLDTYYVYQDGSKKVNLANLKAYLTSELEGVNFQVATADINGFPDVQDPLPNTIYLVLSGNEQPDIYFEYLWLGDRYEYLGSTDIDLSGYYNKSEADILLSGKADTTHGHVISDVTNLQNELNGKEPANVNIQTHISNSNVHFTQNEISITESQISDLGNYEPANANIQTHIPSTNNPHSVTANQVGLGNVQNYDVASQLEAETGTVNNKYMTPLRTAQAIAELSSDPDLTVYDNHIVNTNNPHNVTASQVGAEPANVNIQSHISSTLNPHSVTKTQVGLSNVDNTSDLGKPISTATQTALNDKENSFTKNTAFNKNFGTTAGTVSEGNHLHTGVYEPANVNIQSHISSILNPHNVTKTQVGLSNVDNTSDANKPISTAMQTALNNKLETSLKGSVNGLAELDTNGKVPATQLPSYVDDVLEFSTLANFPATGETGKIYVALNTNIIYRWSGTAYVEISSSLALGETSATAYRGDRGKIAYDHTLLTNNPHSVTKAQVGLSNVDNTSDANKPVSTAQQTALNGKENTFSKNTAFNKNFGTTAGTVTQGNDGRLSDARTPLAHTHGNITNAGAIGSTANLVIQTGTSGVLNAKTAGTTSEFLRGDGVWATPPALPLIYSQTNIPTASTHDITSATISGVGIYKLVLNIQSAVGYIRLEMGTGASQRTTFVTRDGTTSLLTANPTNLWLGRYLSNTYGALISEIVVVDGPNNTYSVSATSQNFATEYPFYTFGSGWNVNKNNFTNIKLLFDTSGEIASFQLFKLA